MALQCFEIWSHIQWNRPCWVWGWRNCNYNNNYSYNNNYNYNYNCYRWTTDYMFPINVYKYNTTTCNVFHSCSSSGILVIGGFTSTADRSVEFWSQTESCILDDYPRNMYSATVNLVSNRLVACFEDTCEIYRDGSWQHLQDTIYNRQLHSSATTKDAVLLIGGDSSNTTEWIPIDGSPAQPGPFAVRHGRGHCTIQTSDDVIVMTGGWITEGTQDLVTQDLVTQYHLTDGKETPLTSMGQPRWFHACAVYQDTNNQKVSKSFDFEAANNAMCLYKSWQWWLALCDC